MPGKEKGTVRTSIMGGGMAKHDIAKFNEDVDDDCNGEVRKGHDPELAKVSRNIC